MPKTSILFFMISSSTLFAHEGHHHAPHDSEHKIEQAPSSVQLVYKNIQNDYQKEIKPIFDQKCASCHSVDSILPWYGTIAPVSWIIKSDRVEAQKHLEISKGFPFAGHGTPLEDLTAIKEEVVKDEMPTFLYRFFHPSHVLTVDEKNIIIKWVDKSQTEISKASLIAPN